MGVWGRVARQGITNKMKINYIFNSIDTTKILTPKVFNISRKSKKIKKKVRKEREYNKRIPRKYSVYIKSKFWVIRRNRYFQDFGRKCLLCNSSKFVQVHHQEYDNNYYGSEKDEMLIGLCRDCHEQFHSIYGTKKKMYNEFDEFTQTKLAEEQREFI